MASNGERPLLARTQSEDSDPNRIEEEDALLTGQPTERSQQASKWTRWRETFLSVYSILATITIIGLAIVVNYQSHRGQHTKEPKDGLQDPDPKAGWGKDGKPIGKRNLIFMVSDGMGPTSLSLTRSFQQYTEGLDIDDILVLDDHLIGSSRTRSSNSLVTDSAAGATAFSCGLKSYNGAISVLPDHSPCGTVLEAAKRAGYMTGLVVTTRLTDATPACFAAHADRRSYEDLIAEQMVGNYPLGRSVDLMMGGGRCFFLPNTTSNSCRSDDTDVVKMAKEDFGWNYIDNREDFDNMDSNGGVKLPLLALFADRDIPYEVDRVHVADVYPSQEEMARFALNALSVATQDSEKGFFLMIEGSRIDHAGHGNDPAAQPREVLAHDRAFSAVLEFLKESESDTPGVLVSTSDHETGGLATARQLTKEYPRYIWKPDVLANASHSAEYLAHKWNVYRASNLPVHSSVDSELQSDDVAEGHVYTDSDFDSDADASKKKKKHKKGKKDKKDKKDEKKRQKEIAARRAAFEYIKSDLLETDFGILDATDEEIDSVIDAEPMWPASYLFADMISRRAQIGWTTHGHTAVDVNIYASNPVHAQALIGNHENTEVGRFLADFLDVDVEAVTQELKEKKVKQAPDESDQDTSSTAMRQRQRVDHYHSDDL